MDTVIEDEQVTDYIKQQTPGDQATITVLMQVIFEAEPAIEVAMKWRRLTFTLNGNWHHWICGIQTTKKGVTLHFHKGWLLPDPGGMLQGQGKHGRLIRFADGEEIDRDNLRILLRQAVIRQTEM